MADDSVSEAERDERQRKEQRKRRPIPNRRPLLPHVYHFQHENQKKIAEADQAAPHYDAQTPPPHRIRRAVAQPQTEQRRQYIAQQRKIARNSQPMLPQPMHRGPTEDCGGPFKRQAADAKNRQHKQTKRRVEPSRQLRPAPQPGRWLRKVEEQMKQQRG